MSALPDGERRRLLRLMGVELYERRPRSTPGPACVLVRLDRPKEMLAPEERRVLARLLKALAWDGPFRAELRAGERAVLELALGIPASGLGERSVEGDSLRVLATSEDARRALWRRIAPHLPLPGSRP